MVDIEQLKQNLTRLTQEAVGIAGGVRELVIPDQGGALAAIIVEIEDTILPRRLIFENDRAESLILNISSRRVMSFARKDNGSFDNQFEEISDRQISLLRETLVTFAATAKRVTLRFEFYDAPRDFANIGVRGMSLHESDGVSETLPASPQGEAGRDLNKFVESCTEIASALVSTEGTKVVLTRGDAGLLSSLQDLALAELSGISDPSEIIAQDQCIVMSGSEGSERAVLCGVSGTQMVFAAFATDRLNEMMTLWSAA